MPLRNLEIPSVAAASTFHHDRAGILGDRVQVDPGMARIMTLATNASEPVVAFLVLAAATETGVGLVEADPTQKARIQKEEGKAQDAHNQNDCIDCIVRHSYTLHASLPSGKEKRWLSC